MKVAAYGTGASAALYRAEALVGTEPAVGALLGLVETKMAEGNVGSVSRLWYELLFLPIMLTRLPAKARNAALGRLEALAGTCDGGSRNAATVRQAIDGALDRGDHDEYCRRATIHGNRDDELIENARTQSLGPGSLIEGRDAWFAGEVIIEIARERWKKAKGDARWAMMEQYGWIKSEQTVRLFTAMFSSKNLKLSLESWFVQRVDYARPSLVDTEKAGGALGKSAAKVLKHLDKTLGAG